MAWTQVSRYSLYALFTSTVQFYYWSVSPLISILSSPGIHQLSFNVLSSHRPQGASASHLFSSAFYVLVRPYPHPFTFLCLCIFCTSTITLTLFPPSLPPYSILLCLCLHIDFGLIYVVLILISIHQSCLARRYISYIRFRCFGWPLC